MFCVGFHPQPVYMCVSHVLCLVSLSRASTASLTCLAASSLIPSWGQWLVSCLLFGATRAPCRPIRQSHPESRLHVRSFSFIFPLPHSGGASVARPTAHLPTDPCPACISVAAFPDFLTLPTTIALSGQHCHTLKSVTLSCREREGGRWRETVAAQGTASFPWQRRGRFHLKTFIYIYIYIYVGDEDKGSVYARHRHDAREQS